MFFTRIGLFLAYVGFFLGLLTTIMYGVMLFSPGTIPSPTLSNGQPYFTVSRIGENLNGSIYLIFGSLALGIVCELSRMVKEIADRA